MQNRMWEQANARKRNKKVRGQKSAAIIGMDGELEYLIKAWKQACKGLENTEAVGAITVRVQGNCRRKHWELGKCGISGSCVQDGREPTWKEKDRIRW